VVSSFTVSWLSKAAGQAPAAFPCGDGLFKEPFICLKPFGGCFETVGHEDTRGLSFGDLVG
jgi:hypothetical protein